MFSNRIAIQLQRAAFNKILVLRSSSSLNGREQRTKTRSVLNPHSTKKQLRYNSNNPLRYYSNTPMKMKMIREVNSMTAEELSNFLNGFDTICSDCDGVLYRAGNGIDGSAQMMQEFARMGKKLIYVTNGSSRTRQGYADKLNKIGCPADKESVVHAGYLTAMYLKEVGFHNTGKKVFLAGERGVQEELTEMGFDFITDGTNEHLDDTRPYEQVCAEDLDPDVGAVVTCYDPAFSFTKVFKAINYLHRDPECLFLSSDVDASFPISLTNILPGTGPFVRGIEAATGRKAVLCGKPSNWVFTAVQRKWPEIQPERTLFIGDRCDADVLTGRRSGLQTLLVGSGIHTLADAKRWSESNLPEHQELVPDFYADSLGQIKKLKDLLL